MNGASTNRRHLDAGSSVGYHNHTLIAPEPDYDLTAPHASRARLLAGVLVSGSKVRTLRLDLALSQDELAERAHLVRSTIIHVEAGGENHEMRPKNVRKLARALGVTPKLLRPD